MNGTKRIRFFHISIVALILCTVFFYIGYVRGIKQEVTEESKETLTTESSENEGDIRGENHLTNQIVEGLPIVNEFLSAFYTYDKLGENFVEYEKYGTKEYVTAEKERLKHINTATNGSTDNKFVQSKNFYLYKNENEFDVLSFVTYTFDLLDSDNKVTENDVEGEITLLITCQRNEEDNHFYINTITTQEVKIDN